LALLHITLVEVVVALTQRHMQVVRAVLVVAVMVEVTKVLLALLDRQIQAVEVEEITLIPHLECVAALAL
jgi:hypothetical protein